MALPTGYGTMPHVLAALVASHRGFELLDIREKILVERRRAAMERDREGLRHRPQPVVTHDDVSDEELAVEAGLIPPPDEAVDMAALEEKKARQRAAMHEQHRRRVASREAFAEWQAGQREKGAAHRLSRESRKAEGHKRLHCESQRFRLLSTAVATEEWNSNNDFCPNLAGALSFDKPGIPRRAEKASDFLNTSQSAGSSSPRKDGHHPSLFLKISKG
jgi:NADH pyrophosphatase NudC (nudix superfamily)